MAEKSERRSLARATMHHRHRNLLQRRLVVLRYLLPSNFARVRTSLNTCDSKAACTALEVAIRKENSTHGDLLYLDTVEGPAKCWRKMILWMEHALAAWPRVGFVGVTDDDVYVSLSRLATDLASVHGKRFVYWGQVRV
jgi:hypothetical protein